MNRKKRKILKINLSGEQERKTSKIAGNNLFGGLFQKIKNKGKQQKQQKHLFACWQTTPNFGTFLFFCQLAPLYFCKAVFCWKNYKRVFSAEHSFCVSQIVKSFSRSFPKWHFSNQKCHFGFSVVPAETPIFVVFGDFVCSQKKWHFSKNR